MTELELPETNLAPETTIHDCLEAAADSKRTPGATPVFSVRIPEDVKKKAMFICERNVTDLGSYLRQCTLALVEDYGVQVEPDQV